MLEDICMTSYDKKHFTRHNKIDRLVEDITSAFPKAFTEIEKFLKEYPDTFVVANKIYFHIVIGSRPEHITDNTTLEVLTIKNANEYFFRLLAKSRLFDYVSGYYFEAIKTRNRLMKAFVEELQKRTSKKIELASGDYTYEFSYFIRVRETEK